MLMGLMIWWAWSEASGTAPTAHTDCPHRLSAPAPVTAKDSIPQLVVGRTYYVTASVLYMRDRPAADEPGNPRSILCRNWPVTVLVVPNRNWAFVRYAVEDYAIDSYVSRWYLSEKKAE
jgi:hypothetical protein